MTAPLDQFRQELRRDAPPVVLFGLTLETAPLETVAEALIGYLAYGDHSIHVVTLNPEILESGLEHPHIMKLLQQADVLVADGVGIQYAAKRLAGRTIPLVPGIDLARALLDRASVAGRTVYLYGGAPGVAESAANAMRLRDPRLQVVGTEHGFHGPDDLIQVTAGIDALAPDLLLVGMGSPLQEATILGLKLGLPLTVCIGVGGTFDVWAGVVRRAPVFFQRLKLEWFWRIALQPSRWSRLPRLVQFGWRVLVGG